MREGPDIAGVADAIADPARAAMLCALMDGRALTAGELAREAGVTPQTASTHLARLRDAGLITHEPRGRHRYARLAGPAVSSALESLMALAQATGRRRTRPGPRDERLREARICYDHLAGAAGVALLDAFSGRGFITCDDAGGLRLTPAGADHLRAQGIDPEAPPRARRPFCRACLDWSERRPHLAGLLGARLLEAFIARGWLRRDGVSRLVTFTPPGRLAFRRLLEA